uniref:Phosphoglycerate mutase family protein n=1 Tax=Syphacia muris TaxID=451379 RepID=A0A0N5AWX0_9BILA
MANTEFGEKMTGMTYWVVRHAEREDNISHEWRKKSNLKSDNSPLSKRGQGQADELNPRFKDVHIDYVFASPYDRCLETATRLLNGKNIPIKVEPGLAEALYLCEYPPGYESLEILKKKYPLVDTDYKSVMRWDLPKEGFGDDACIGRVRKTLDAIAERYPILLVSHGAPIGAIHEILTGTWKYVGQATVSKFVETESGKYKKVLSSDASHLSDKSNLRPW